MEVDINKERVLGFLKEKGMSKVEFANKMGILRQNLDALLESKKKDINVVIKMAEVLEIPFDEFAGMVERRKPQPEGIIKYKDSYWEIKSKEDLENLLIAINLEN
ncbi:MAG: helix-turn-helix transcriptional regulator [Bacteroidales bacterium]|nr:helix-turn-helix transcriptional regulator [Bacteroidales bacterium]